LAWAAGIKDRIGYVTSKRSILLTKKIQPPDIARVHRIDYYLGVIKGAGLPVRDRHTDFFYSQPDREAVRTFLDKNSISGEDIIIGLNPGGNWGPKRWPAQNFSLLADRLFEELGARVIFTGSEADTPVVSAIRAKMRSLSASACGEFSLKQFAALCARMSVFVSADSGPMHIANAAGTRKIIALFGPTHPMLTGPVPQDRVTIIRKSVGCQIPCYKTGCSDNRCMAAISVEDVFAQVKSSLDVHAR
jgi:lipopolysaccharide heptosyltransferase II